MKHGFLQKEAPIIAITSDLNSQLAKYATVILPIPNVEHADFKVSTFSSQLAIEYILNVLYSCIFSRNFDKNYTSQKIHLLRYLNFKQKKNSTDDQYCFSNQEDRIRTCDPLSQTKCSTKLSYFGL